MIEIGRIKKLSDNTNLKCAVCGAKARIYLIEYTKSVCNRCLSLMR